MKSVFALLASILLATGSEAACPFGHGSGGENRGVDVFESRNISSSVEPFTVEDYMQKARAKVQATAGKAGPWPTTPELLSLFLEDMSVTEDAELEEFESRGFGVRKKLIHSSGAIAEARIEWKTNPYTGLFEAANYGFIRMSSAVKPDYTNSDSEAAEFTPGFGMKFFRDYVPSGNLFALAKLTPSDSWNFFKHKMSNHLPVHDMPAKQGALVKKFATAPSDWPGFTGLSAFARYNEGSDLYIHPRFPFQLIFEPNEDLQAKFPDSGTGLDLFSTQLKDLPAGQHLYSVYAKDTRTAPQQHIGDVYTTTKFIESSYADETMFLQHTRFEDDMKLRPDFLDGCTGISDCKVCPMETTCD